MEFSPETGGTSVRWTVRGDCRGFFRVPQRILLSMGRHEMRLALENLKGLLDVGAAALKSGPPQPAGSPLLRAAA